MMSPRRKKRLILMLVLVFGLGSSISLVIYALSQNMDLFYTPTEIINGKPDGSKPHVGQRLRIGGMVVTDSIERDLDSLKISFRVVDIGPEVTVEFEGILPDLFREGQGVVAQGILINATTVQAQEVLAKHDENYIPPEVAEAMNKVHQPLEYTQQQKQGSY